MQYRATLTSPLSATRPVETPVGGVRHTRRTRTRDARTAVHAAGVLAVALLVIAAVVVAVLTLAARPDAPEPEAWASISVGATDSVWAVAAAHPVQGYSTASTVELICARNNLRSATVHPGQLLLVPHAPAAQTAVALR